MKNKKIALVTGSTSGIGREIALQLSQKNFHILLTGKDKNKLEKIHDEIAQHKGSSSIYMLDLKDHDGIDRLGFEIFKRFKVIDILILNAGVLGTLGPLHHQNADEFQEVININLIANFRLIRSLDSMLKAKNSKGIALIISSGVANNPRAYWGAYAISKSALENMAKIWAAENIKTNLKINIINPGATRTKMRASAVPGEDPNSNPSAREVASKIILCIDDKNLKHGELIEIK